MKNIRAVGNVVVLVNPQMDGDSLALGTVQSIGHEVDGAAVSFGDRVVVSRYAGQELVKGEVWAVRCGDILCVIDAEESAVPA